MAAKKTAVVEKAERAVILRERDVLRLVNRLTVAHYRGDRSPSLDAWLRDLRRADTDLLHARLVARAKRAARKAAR